MVLEALDFHPVEGVAPSQGPGSDSCSTTSFTLGAALLCVPGASAGHKSALQPVSQAGSP